MGQLKNREIHQTRRWNDPSAVTEVPSFDYDFIYPITVYDAVRRTMDDNATSLTDEINSIYRLIAQKQAIIGAGKPGHLMTWSGAEGQIGDMEVSKSIPTKSLNRSHERIPTEKAVGDILDTRVPNSTFADHSNDQAIHVTDVERTKWNGMAPLTTLQAHVSNSSVHVTTSEKNSWNKKADLSMVEDHVLDNANNPHNVTAHQTGAYTQQEVDDLFAAIRESFFNYRNIEWDATHAIANLVEYREENWNPNFVLSYGEDLPEITDTTGTYFALRPATDYMTNETQDCVIWIKRPGLVWQELSIEPMHPGDMVILYPQTRLLVWIQGRFVNLFSESNGVGDEEVETSDIVWYPKVVNGIISFVRSSSTVPPDPVLIKGEDGHTPVKGIDYRDGVDGVGVPVGGVTMDLLVKNTDENYNTTWRSLLDILADLIVAGASLPEGIISWNSIGNKPEIYQELGEHEDGLLSQKAITNNLSKIHSDLSALQSVLQGAAGLDKLSEKISEHLNDINNPHRTTPAAIGAVSTQTFVAHTGNYANPHMVTADQIGLGNVNNTSDMDKPISIAQQRALDELAMRLGTIGDDVSKYNYVNNITWNASTCTLTVTFRDTTEMDIVIPIASVFDSMFFDTRSNELVITQPDGSQHRIDISTLIKPYTGGNSANIQVQVEGSVIKASVLPSTIGDYEIVPSVHLRNSPTTTTQPVTDRSTRIATTEFVRNVVINTLVSYETDRPLSANMGRILNQTKAETADVLELINAIDGITVVDNLESESRTASLTANMGRFLNLTKAPYLHTSETGTEFGRASMNLYGHARASNVDPLMDGTVSKGTDDGCYARGDHRHPRDVSRAPMHWPDTELNQIMFTGEPKAVHPADQAEGNELATAGWTKKMIGKRRIFEAGLTAPSDTGIFWVDTGENKLKYYNGSDWVAISV